MTSTIDRRISPATLQETFEQGRFAILVSQFTSCAHTQLEKTFLADLQHLCDDEDTFQWPLRSVLISASFNRTTLRHSHTALGIRVRLRSPAVARAAVQVARTT